MYFLDVESTNKVTSAFKDTETLRQNEDPMTPIAEQNEEATLLPTSQNGRASNGQPQVSRL